MFLIHVGIPLSDPFETMEWSIDRDDAPDGFRLWFLPFVVDPRDNNAFLPTPLSRFDDIDSRP